jgi:DNA-nicking Smr family endonuclease
MGKKRKRPAAGSASGAGGDEEPQAPLPRVPERLSSPFKGALDGVKKKLEEAAKTAEEERKKPPAPPRPITRKTQRGLSEDAVALSLAMQGVKPLSADRPGRVTATTPKITTRTAQVVPFGRSAEDEARERLDALVAQDVSFRIERDQGFVRAARVGAPPRELRELGRRTRASETLDLHGMNQREAREAVIGFVRRCHRQGLTVLCVVHGKGQHSDDGRGVLQDVVVQALTNSAAATLIHAFVTAPEALGGSGALLVELRH